MAKTGVTQWDQNPNNNTDINGIVIAPGWLFTDQGNAFRTIMAQLAAYIGAGFAVAADLFAGTATNKLVAPSTISAATAPVVLADGNTITPANGFNFTIALAALASGTRTLANPTGFFAGQSGIISLKQDSSGGRKIDTYGSAYDFGRAGVPTLSGANLVDKISYFADSPTHLTCSFLGGYSA